MEFINNYSSLNNFENSIENAGHSTYMSLNILVDFENETEKELGIFLTQKYINAAEAHNLKIINDGRFYDAGFDIYLPPTSNNNTLFSPYEINKVDFKIKCSAKMVSMSNNLTLNNSFFTSYYTYARSSISKTPLRLANNQGIIDAGYRGNIIGMFDCLQQHKDVNLQQITEGIETMIYVAEPYTRLLQICSPNLCPIYVNIVEDISELSEETSRGIGGIGSTGTGI